MNSSIGIVDVFRKSPAHFPNYSLSESFAGSGNGYCVIGSFTAANNNGVILAPSLFLRNRQATRNTAVAWAGDLMQWVQFVEVVQAAGLEPPYSFDLMSVSRETFEKFGAFLTHHAVSRAGDQLATDTVRSKLIRVAHAYEWFSSCGWYQGDLGPRAKQGVRKLSVAPLGLLAHTKKPKADGLGPMGSRFAQTINARRPASLPKALTESNMAAIRKVCAARLESVPKKDPRWAQFARDELVFNTGWTVGLRVENIVDLRADQVLKLRLDGLRDTQTLKLDMIGKGRRVISPSFPVALLRQMQAYAETLRAKAVIVAKKAEPTNLFVVHVGAKRGEAVSRRGVQQAMENLFIDSGLFTRMPKKNKFGQLITDDSGNPILRAHANFSVHSLRHTCAMRMYYSVYDAIGNRDEAMAAVQDQLCHANIETTEKEYAELTRQFSSWLSFSEGADAQRLAEGGDDFEVVDVE